MKRLCIYLTYDKQNIIDRYIGYMLKELKTCVDYLAVVCNEKEIIRGADILERYADIIFYRENIGFDAGGFKDALCDLIGWNKVLQYDELLLVNDSMFGPFRSMRSIFAEMDKKPFDFWGLAKHGEGYSPSLGAIPEHIQSYFLLIRSRMLHNREFIHYWERMPYFASLDETIKGYEMSFTGYFSDLGYTFGCLADMEANDSINYLNNYTQYGMIPFEMIRKRNFPFLKKQPFCDNTLYCQTQESLRQAISFIDKNTDYDIELIWDNMIRSFNIRDLQRNLHLQYIISSGKETVICQSIAVLIFIAYKESAEYVLEYLENVNPAYDIQIVSDNDNCLEEYEKHGFVCKKIVSGEIVSLYSSLSRYDFVCVLHDADMVSDRKPSCMGKSYFYNIWENLFKNNSHVSEIIKYFTEEPRLGFLAAPSPDFAEYFGTSEGAWNKEFEAIQYIIKELNIRCQISELMPPFRITDNFWVRGCILEKLKNLRAEKLSYLSYLWTYLAQDAGYYSGIVESADYAAMSEVNLRYYLNCIISQIKRQCGNFARFHEMQAKITESALERFSAKYSRIFIYGAGEIAQKNKSLLRNIEAYIVSDGQRKPKDIDGVPVKYLSEIAFSNDCGIVLFLNQGNQKQVISLLEEKGITNYFTI